ncbi:hypothetical protein [Desulfocastanea catecholica]
MIDTGKTVKSKTVNRAPLEAATPKLIAGAIFGLVVGFLLQKGGVGKYNVLHRPTASSGLARREDNAHRSSRRHDRRIHVAPPRQGEPAH